MPDIGLSPSPRSLRPRRDRYIHRPIIVVADGRGLTEDGVTVNDLARFALEAPPYIWVTLQTPDLLAFLHSSFGVREDWQFRLVRTDHNLDGGRAIKARTRLDRFGFRAEGQRKQSMHMVWDPSNMTQSRDLSFLPGRDYLGLLEWAIALRDLHEQEDMALTTTLAGIAGKWLKDKRFWPDDRRRVPRATNERARSYLPGVHTDLKASLHVTRPDVVSLDQVKAYHTVAQEIALPNPNELHARGYFNDPLNCVRTWAPVGGKLYERIVNQHGLLFIRGNFAKRSPKLFEVPAAVSGRGFAVYGIWTNEYQAYLRSGFTPIGMVAALTSSDADVGLARYANYARTLLSSDFGVTNKSWLKPLLHTTYGMLGARPAAMTHGFRYAEGGEGKNYHIGVHEYRVKEMSTRIMQSPTANVVMFGMLQAEVRKRTLELANSLLDQGVEVTQVHADGMHVVGQLPFIDSRWVAEPLTDVRYVDAVSWVSKEKKVLPGRSGSARDLLQSAQGRRLDFRLSDPERVARGYKPVNY